MVSTIGIKIANGEFYSVIDENSELKRRLILTTVHNNQQSVQIDLYKSFTRTMADALYIGSLVVEDINPQQKGEPSIELVITSSRNGDITADAVDMDASAKGEHQTLSVSLKSLEEDTGEYEMPDFELDGDETGLAGQYERTSEIGEYDGGKKFPWLIVICAALVLAAIGIVLWIFFFQSGGSLGSIPARIRQMTLGQKTETARPAETSAQFPASSPAALPDASQVQIQAPAEAAPVSPAPVATQEPVTQPAPPGPPSEAPPVERQPVAQAQAVQTPPPVIVAPVKAPEPPVDAVARRDRSSAPVASYNVPSVIPREGVSYRIRYGDTLWDIAGAFYRNPWLYPRIARFNNIRNPDRIISGTTIRVPPKN